MISTLHDKRVIDIAGGFYHTIALVKNKKVKDISKLSSDMKKIINEPTRADVTFLVDNGEKPIFAHRCIIMARCRRLHEKIAQEGRVSEERDKNRWGTTMKNHMTFVVKNTSYKAFVAFVEYLYTDNLQC